MLALFCISHEIDHERHETDERPLASGRLPRHQRLKDCARPASVRILQRVPASSFVPFRVLRGKTSARIPRSQLRPNPGSPASCAALSPLIPPRTAQPRKCCTEKFFLRTIPYQTPRSNRRPAARHSHTSTTDPTYATPSPPRRAPSTRGCMNARTAPHHPISARLAPSSQTASATIPAARAEMV